MNTIRLWLIATLLALLPGTLQARPFPQDQPAKQAEPAAPHRDLEKPDIPAKVLKLAIPEYPELARRDGVSGTIQLIVLVDEKGAPVEVVDNTFTGDGHDPRLMKAAYHAAMQCTFIPATKNGRAIPSHVSVPFAFKRN